MLSLTDHAFFCYTNRHCVFLDLSRDRYLSTERAPVERLVDHVTGQSTLNELDSELAAKLTNLGLATTDSHGGKAFAPTTTNLAITELATVSDTTLTRASLTEITSFFLSAFRSEFLLKRLPIQKVVTHAKRVRPNGRIDNDDYAAEKAARLMRSFRRLRPAFPTNSICLRDSFMAISYLAKFGVYPSWVFAVATDPFGAHCWLQIGDAVLTEEAASVRRFQPIMVV